MIIICAAIVFMCVVACHNDQPYNRALGQVNKLYHAYN